MMKNKNSLGLLSTILFAFLALPKNTQAAGIKYFSYNGSGVWNNSAIAWSASASGPYNIAWDAYSDAIFQGTSGTLTVDAIAANSMHFTSSGYQLNGGQMTLGSPLNGPGLTVETGMTAHIGSVLSRAGGQTYTRKLGAGTLSFSGNSNFGQSYGLSVAAGVFEINGHGQLDSGNFAGPIQIAENATLKINSEADNTWTYGYGVGGWGGNLSKDNEGELTLKRFTLNSVNAAQTVTVNGGKLTIEDWWITGMGSIAAGTGRDVMINQTGGEIHLKKLQNSSQLQFANWGGTTTANFSGGSITIDSFYVPNFAQRGTGIVTISGTSTVTSLHPEGISLSGQATGSGQLNLNPGGTLVTSRIQRGGGVAQVNFDGGLLKANASHASFLQGLNTAKIRSGGLKLNTNGYNITVAQPLSEDSASPGGGLTKLGAGVLSLKGNNTFTGPTLIEEGTVKLLSNPAIPENLKIYPVGDSITFGNNSGYRYPLYQLLNPVAPSFRFVGDSNISAGSLPSSPIDQRYHAGHSSYSVTDINNNLDGLDTTTFQQFGGADRNPNGGYWFTGGNGTGREPLFPDLILLLCGANDIARIGMTGAQARVEALLIKITTLRPDARIMLAKVTPFVGKEADVTTYNNILTTVAANFQANGKKVTLVDLFTGFDPAWLPDGLHPNATGYQWMANKWYEAILQVYANANNSQALSMSTSVQVAAGARLEGSGQLGGSLTVEGSVAPGDAIGALTAGSTEITGKYECQLSGIHSDQLIIDGNLDLNGAEIQLSEVAPRTANAYIVATYTGSLAPFTTPPVLTGVSGYQLDTSTAGQVKIVLTPYQSWVNGFQTPALVDSSPIADPDRDGVPNLIEFILGGDPRTRDHGLLPTILNEENELVMDFNRNDAAATGVNLVGQWSNDLQEWHDVPVQLIDNHGSEPDEMRVSVSKSNAQNGKLFMRLKAE